MRKNVVYIIIVVLTIALVGLVYVQSIYIKRGTYIQSQVFDQYVSESLMRTAFQIEQQEAYNYFNSPSNLRQLYRGLSKSTNIQDDFAIDFYNGNYTLQINKGDSTYTFTARSLQLLDSIVKFSNIKIDNESLWNDEQSISQYNQMFQSMALQFMYGNENESLYIDSSEIVEILDFELKRSGINTKYNFAIVDGYALRPIVSNFEHFSKAILRTAYTTQLNLNSLFGKQLILTVDFPKKRAFIFQSNKELLISSLLFIVLIAGSFGASIYVIYKQKKLSELKTDFINNMTHELKTPVATISLAAEMLKKDKVIGNKDRVLNYTNIINDENKRLGSHIEKVLQIAQLERESLKLKLEDIDMHELLDEVLHKFTLRINEEKAKISINKNAEKYIVRGDITHITNIYTNLIDNALKYRKKDRNLLINIETQNKNELFEFSITDNGIGMSSANQTKIFTQFFRIPTGNLHNVKGFGLGLSYVKTILEAHYGKISVSSELDKQTKFTIQLPIKK